MTLSFPTLAEQALAKFRNSKKTISLVTICTEMDAQREDCYPKTTWTFDDDTSLVVSGRGRNHTVEVLLP